FTMTNAVASSSKGSANLFTDISGGRKVKDKFATIIIYAAMVLALAPLAWVLITVLTNGLSSILQASWWGFDMAGQPTNKPGGGIAHAMIGTLMQVLVTSL